MHNHSYSRTGKLCLGLSLLLILFAAADLPAAHAQAGVIPTDTVPVDYAVPPNFTKNSPINGVTVQGTTVTLDWHTAGTDITGYYHCYDKTNNGKCDGNQWAWNNDTNRTITGLQVGSTYYWQILACNLTACVEANYGQWWSFTVVAAPASAQTGPTPAPALIEPGPLEYAVPTSFYKRFPGIGEIVQGIKVTLDWSSAGTGITGYYHCVDKTNNDICDANQWDWNDDTNRTLLNLDPNSTYYWQILACNNEACVGADGGAWFSFKTAAVFRVYTPVTYR